YKQGVAFEGYLNYESNIKALTETKLSYSAERQADSLKMVAIMNEISMQKEQAIKQLQYEYEKKQQQTKNEKEKEKLKYEETLKREKIEFDYNKKTQELKFQEDLKRRKIAFDFEQKKQQISSEQKRKEILLKSEQEKKNAVSQKEIEKQKLLRNSFIGGAFLLLLVAFSIFRSLLQNRKANIIITEQKMEVEKQKEFVDERNREILDSIKYAKRIQSTILPPLSKIKSAIPNVFVLYLPKDIVAGDFYWMYSHTINGEENRLFAACDCTGHGVPGAMVSVVCNNALNRVVREMDNCKPSLILDKVSELVIQDFSLNNEDDDEVKDGMDISLCSFNPANGILQWAGANNPLWIIKANGSLLEYKADKQPVGKYYNRKPFTNHEIQLEKGDTLYLFTDGYADQFGGEKNSKFQRKALKKLLVSGYLQTMDQQQENLFKTFENWKGINEQVDDICIIGVRV
ncbi:MAG TPA: SpoIIE family protein phosphatase, partial [Bacteroidia bacterium]|nr:SpoIIE family protein phosphatase [Bacteroidia bacterium]